MAPPTNLPRLSQLSPEVVADQVLELVVEQASRLVLKLSPAYQLDGRGAKEARSSDLWFTVQALTVYAQTGIDAETRSARVAAEYAWDRMAEICALLWSRAAEPGTFAAPILEEVEEDPETAIGAVLLSAAARVKIQQGQPLSTREVGALASVSANQVRLLIRAGEITRDKEGHIPAEEARRWLSGRGVPRF